MRARRPFAVPLFAMLVAVALAAACATTDDANPPSQTVNQAASVPRPGGRVVVGTVAEADGFLPAINRWTPASYLIARTIFDPLATLDDTGTPRPYLAESFTPTANFTQWTIKLRPNITFHDGSPLTSEALVKHFEAAQASEVVGAAIRSFDRYSSIDPLTFVVELKQPWAHLPALMSSQLGYIPAPKMYDKANTTAASNPVGTGPFKFTSWTQNQRLIVDRYPSYWRKDREGRALPYLSQVEFQPVPDDNLRSSRLRSGQLDIIHTDAYSEVSSFQRLVRDEPNGRIRALLDNSQSAESGIVLNTQTGPFADRDLRLAAAYAIDRQALVDEMFKGFYEVANGPYTARSRWGAASNWPTYFPERARQLINEWKTRGRGRGAPVINVTNLAVADSVQMAQRIAKWWTDVGFDVRLRNEEEKVGSVDLVMGYKDAIMLRFWDRTDPDGLYHFLGSESITPPGKLSLNFSRYQSATIDEAFRLARGSADDAYRRQQYQKIWDDLAQNLPVLFMYHTRWAFGYQSKIHGLGELTLPDGARAESVTWGNLYLTGVWVD
jgi:peptide/nickel transport system substrate-binding protein